MIQAKLKRVGADTGRVPAAMPDIFRERKFFNEYKEIISSYLAGYAKKLSLKERMSLTLQLAFSEAIITNTDEAARLLDICGEHITLHGRPEDKAAMHNIRCRLHLQYAEYEQALAEGIRSLYLFRRLDFPFFTMNTSTCCGIACSRMNLNTEAIDHHTRAHSIAIQMGDKRAAIFCTANLNDLRISILPLAECITHNKDLLAQVREVFGDEPSMAEIGAYQQLGYIYMKEKDLARADSYAAKSLSVLAHFPHLPPHHFLYTNLFALKSEIEANRGDEEAMHLYAAECTKRGALINKKMPEIDVLMICFKYYLSRGETQTAKGYIDKVAEIIPPGDRSSSFLHLNENMCSYYNTIGDSVNEMLHFKIIHEYKIKSQQEALTGRSKYISTVYELEIMQKESEMQKKELEFKTQELNMATYYLQQRNELLSDLQENINNLRKLKSTPDIIVKTISEKIKQASAMEEADKVCFKEKFDEAQREFISQLHKQYTMLSTTECRICALLRSGFNTKEIAHLLSSSTRTVENHRANIRNKMNLDRTTNLNMILSEIG
jgi:DNA-binding CsgD family transcriptional regulator